jgi:hypothetical protein
MILEPSIRDCMKTKWELDLAKQTNKPEGTATLPPPRDKTKIRRSIEEDHAASSEDLDSDSDWETAPAFTVAKDDTGRNANPGERASTDAPAFNTKEIEVVDLISSDEEGGRSG